jgi:hypothetical protein
MKKGLIGQEGQHGTNRLTGRPFPYTEKISTKMR